MIIRIVHYHFRKQHHEIMLLDAEIKTVRSQRAVWKLKKVF